MINLETLGIVETRQYTRECPKCKKTLYYGKKHSRDFAEQKNKICQSCSKRKPQRTYERSCPKCNCIITYSSFGNFNIAVRKNSGCQKCFCGSYNKIDDRRLTRNCPKCNCIITHTDLYNRVRSERNKVLCRSCSSKIGITKNKGIHTENVYKKISVSNTGKHHTMDTRKKMSNLRKGKKPSLQTRLKRSKSLLGKRKGYKHTEEAKHKLRLATIADLENKGIRLGKANNYNFNSCKFIDNINTMLGLNLQHARNGGEVKIYGYFLDGYDKEKNIVFEYDERKHFNTDGTLKSKDIIRQNNIIRQIHPTLFLRYDEPNKRLYDAETNSTIQIL